MPLFKFCSIGLTLAEDGTTINKKNRKQFVPFSVSILKLFEISGLLKIEAKVFVTGYFLNIVRFWSF